MLATAEMEEHLHKQQPNVRVPINNRIFLQNSCWILRRYSYISVCALCVCVFWCSFLSLHWEKTKVLRATEWSLLNKIIDEKRLCSWLIKSLTSCRWNRSHAHTHALHHRRICRRHQRSRTSGVAIWLDKRLKLISTLVQYAADSSRQSAVVVGSKEITVFWFKINNWFLSTFVFFVGDQSISVSWLHETICVVSIPNFLCMFYANNWQHTLPRCRH